MAFFNLHRFTCSACTATRGQVVVCTDQTARVKRVGQWGQWWVHRALTIRDTQHQRQCSRQAGSCACGIERQWTTISTIITNTKTGHQQESSICWLTRMTVTTSQWTASFSAEMTTMLKENKHLTEVWLICPYMYIFKSFTVHHDLWLFLRWTFCDCFPAIFIQIIWEKHVLLEHYCTIVIACMPRG